jgi:3',5'-cyclic AMP phosphodiesterase CpdA
MRTIAHISDLHFGRHSPTVAQDLITSVTEQQPDLVVLSGDFTQRARHGEFAEAHRFLGHIPQPKLVVPGNHDVPVYNVLSRFLTPLAKFNHYVSAVGLPAGLFRDEEIAVLGLNTARSFTRKSGRVSLEQIAQIRRAFSDVPQGIFKTVVTHHPLGFPDGEAALELAGLSHLALDAVRAAGVHLLLSGHHHRALSGHIGAPSGDIGPEMSCGGSVLVLHAGTAISTRLRGAEGNTYNLIRIAGLRLSVSVMEWSPGQGFQESRCLSYVLVTDRWRPL